MTAFSRRAALRAAAALLSAPPVSGAPFVARAAAGRIVVVGGGPGGAAAAGALKRWAPELSVTLIEASPRFFTCFMSNEALTGARSVDSLAVGMDGLRALGVDVVFDAAAGIDAGQVVCRSGARFPYDRCVVAPGVDFLFDALPGYSEAAAEIMPHAYKAGPQTALLARKLAAAPDGATFVMTVPANPYRCPPGPYERAGLVADYFRRNKPRSKVLILDAKNSFSKQRLFEEGWRRRYGYGAPGALIEWVSADRGGAVVEIDAAGGAVVAGGGRFKGDVVNVVPPQTAGRFARDVGLAPGGWAAVDTRSFESKILPGVHVVGDAGVMASMPKSAFSAASQGKAAAAAIIAALYDRPPATAPLINTCYSFIAPDYCVSIVGVYRSDADGTTLRELPDSGGLSPLGQNDDFRAREARFARAWYANFRADVWGEAG